MPEASATAGVDFGNLVAVRQQAVGQYLDRGPAKLASPFLALKVAKMLVDQSLHAFGQGCVFVEQARQTCCRPG